MFVKLLTTSKTLSYPLGQRISIHVPVRLPQSLLLYGSHVLGKLPQFRRGVGKR
jgi:hypothetical protein